MRSAAVAANGMNNAELELLKARVGQLEAEAKMNDRSVKTYRLFAEYEEEPEQSIARVGLGVDLPLFNRYEEKKRLAKVRARQKALEAESLQRMQRTKLEALERRLHALMRHHEALKRQRRKQAELLALFTEGYETAQTSLLDLIQAQNGLIETKRKLLQIRYLNDLYHIQIDYLQGTDR
ncbi:TolC family protein [Hydrogenimonas sp.]